MIRDCVAHLVAFSHVRWNAAVGRPQRLLTHAARDRRVSYVEDAVLGDHGPLLQHRVVAPGITVVTPLLPNGISEPAAALTQRLLLDAWLLQSHIDPEVLWYCTPLAMAYSAHLDAPIIAYDCMEDLGACRGTPDGVSALERLLLERSDVVFTDGLRLYEPRRALHDNVHVMSSCAECTALPVARVRGEGHPAQRHLRFEHVATRRVLNERRERLDGALDVSSWQALWQRMDGLLLPQLTTLEIA